MPIGAHIRTSGGLSMAVPRAREMGAECMQIFLGSPQRWMPIRHPEEDVATFKSAAREAGIGPNFVHAIYLINLAAAEGDVRSRSIGALKTCLTLATRCELDAAIVHVGSGRGQSIDEAERQVAAGLEEVLAAGGTMSILLENSAGSGDTLGSRFEQLGGLLERLAWDKRLGVCLDTAHAFASGYDLSTKDGLEEALLDLDAHVGVKRVKAIHANDSRAALNSALDRHENIGKGLIGEEAFSRMLEHPMLAPLPWLLEVPGYANEGPDKENVDTLKRLAGRPVST
jgi:deoxyribonuclease IV